MNLPNVQYVHCTIYVYLFVYGYFPMMQDWNVSSTKNKDDTMEDDLGSGEDDGELDYITNMFTAQARVLR